MTQKIDISKLSPQERKALLAEATALQKQEKEKRKADRKAFKELSEEFVKQNINFLTMHHEATERIIEDLFKEYESVLQLKKEVYGTEREEQDSHTSTLTDGSASITIGWNVSIGFDGTESEGVKKIKGFITSLSDDSEKVKKLAKMVNTFLRPNTKTGMLNPAKIIELSKLRDEFNNDDFNDGLDIIFNAQIRRRNSMYVSGWNFIQVAGQPPRKLEFRFTV